MGPRGWAVGMRTWAPAGGPWVCVDGFEGELGVGDALVLGGGGQASPDVGGQRHRDAPASSGTSRGVGGRGGGRRVVWF
jgi:hypothetical protein